MDKDRETLPACLPSTNLGELSFAWLGKNHRRRRPLLAGNAARPLSRWRWFFLGDCGKILPSQADRAVMELAQKINVEALSNSRKSHTMKTLFSSPSLEDFIQLLKAWRLWLVAAFLGALIAAAIYYIAPPSYQARTTVNVDFNLEQAWPQDTDRQQFYYLERETRKLEEIAWSDAVLQTVSENHHVSVGQLRDGKLILSQPAEAGWHFYAKDKNKQRAAKLASTWAQAFTEKARENIGQSDGLNAFIKVETTQSTDLPVKRSVSLSSYLLAGAITGMTLAALFVLFFYKNK